MTMTLEYHLIKCTCKKFPHHHCLKVNLYRMYRKNVLDQMKHIYLIRTHFKKQS